MRTRAQVTSVVTSGPNFRGIRALIGRKYSSTATGRMSVGWAIGDSLALPRGSTGDDVGDQVGEGPGREVLLHPLGHQRLPRGRHLVDVGAEQDLVLALLAAEGDGRGRRAGYQHVEDAAVDRGDR